MTNNTNHMNTIQHPTFGQLKRAFLESGFEIRRFPRQELEGLALDAPEHSKRHADSNIMGLIMPDEGVIGITAELSADDQVETLVHELIHLYDEELPEDSVEDMTEEVMLTLTPAQHGFLRFLVS
jgi:hypothetical protein